jgi:integrase
MNNPIPVPPGEFVANFENSFGLISGSIPEPVSLILTIACLSFFCVLIVMLLPACLVVNFIAFPNKFDITSLNTIKKVKLTFCEIKLLSVAKVPAEEEVARYRQVTTFLSSVERNSLNSRYAYQYGLIHFQRFLSQKHPDYNLETILKPLGENKINTYELLDGFISYLQMSNGTLTPSSVKLYMSTVRAYLGYYDVDIIPSKFKRKVKMPKSYREDEEALDSSDIRRILLACNNRRLKTYLLVLASGGMRAVEGLAIRIKDIDFSVNPTKIHIRKEYAKTRVGRDIYISNEATHYLKQWLDWKYNNPESPRQQGENDLVFTIYRNKNPSTLYVSVLSEFQKLLAIVGLNERKEGGKQRRRKITLHSFRRFTKSVISDQVSQDFSEWFLGHNKSPYYTKKEPERREIFGTRCMKYLTFLDYTTLEARGKSIEANLQEKDREISGLKEKYDTDIALLKERMMDMQQVLNSIQSR